MESMEHKTSDPELLDLIFRKSCGASVSKNRRMRTMEDDKGNNPTILASSRSRNKIPSGWRVLSKDEDRLASDLYWSRSCSEWLLIGEYRVDYANEPGHKWHAIRQMDRATEFHLHDNCYYKLPNGQTIRITAKGFELATD